MDNLKYTQIKKKPYLIPTDISYSTDKDYPSNIHYQQPTVETIQLENTSKRSEKLLISKLILIFMKDKKPNIPEIPQFYKKSEMKSGIHKYESKLANIVDGSVAILSGTGFIYAVSQLTTDFRIEPLFGALGCSLVLLEIALGRKYDKCDLHK